MTENIPGQGTPGLTVCADKNLAAGALRRAISERLSEKWEDRCRAMRRAREVIRMNGGTVWLPGQDGFELSMDHYTVLQPEPPPGRPAPYDRALTLLTRHLGPAAAESLLDELVAAGLIVVEH